MVGREPVHNNDKNARHAFFNKSFILILLSIIAVAARIFTALRYEINWDEFYYLSFVYRFISEQSINSFQTFHVHFFTWLRWVSENEVNQIIAARMIMLTLQLITGYFIFRICRRQLSFSASLFAVLAYFSFSYVIRTGASFRTDPIATCCLIISLDYLLTPRPTTKHSMISGGLTALAFAITLKSVLYLPAFLLIVLFSLIHSKKFKTKLYSYTIYLISIVLTFLVFYLSHVKSIGVATIDSDTLTMANSADKTLNHSIFLPGKKYLFITFSTDIGFWFSFLYGCKSCIVSFFKKTPFDKKSSLKLLALTLPLMSVFYYRNTFPYFYSFMLAPASILCGVAWTRLSAETSRKENHILVGICLMLFFVNIIFHGLFVPYKRTSEYQHNLLNVVHKNFPDPVPYLDRCSMVSSFPQKGFFMSTWGMDVYRGKGQPILKHAIDSERPIFMIINSKALDFLNTPATENDKHSLLKEDLQALKSTYIPHWNELYVAGKQLSITAKEPNISFNLTIPGKYTLEADSTVFVNGSLLSPQQTLYLSKGKHVMSVDKKYGTYTLRWGQASYRPPEYQKETRVFTGF